MISWMEQRKRAARRRRLLRVLAGMAAAVALAFLAGAALPAEHRTTARESFDRPPEAVWRVLTDLEGMSSWRSDLDRIERLPAADGRMTWREVGSGEDQVMELTESDPPRRLVIHRREDGRPGLPERIVQLRATINGTLVTVTERAKVGNPLVRVLVRLGARESPGRRLLADLHDRLGANRHSLSAEERTDDGH
ncbi:MAG TPA: SRPBCC family protein [Gemmatimonadales bacterium]|nr:SRPBCC family protein [Gemmatimonadales bacterium]